MADDFIHEYVGLMLAQGRLDRLEFLLDACQAALDGDLVKLEALRQDSKRRYLAAFGHPPPRWTASNNRTEGA